MYNQRAIENKVLPIPHGKRRTTDVACSCLHLASVIAMLVAAGLAVGGRTGGEGCGGGARVWGGTGLQWCVEECPSDHVARSGVCFPEDQQQLDYFLSHSPYRMQWETANMVDVVVFTLAFAASLSLVMLGISYFASRVFQRTLTLLAVLMQAYLILALLQVTPHPVILGPLLDEMMLEGRAWVIGLGVSCGVLLLWVGCFNRELSWNGMVMDMASGIMPQKALFIVSVIEYYIKAAIIFALFAFQHFAFSSHSDLFTAWLSSPSFSPLLALNMAEYLWNLQFIKDTLYFSLANYANSYYFGREMECCDSNAIACRHSGSLSGGALVNSIFTVPNCLLDCLCCFPKERRENCALWYTSLTGIARSDAYAYQSLAAIPYCNSSRQCRRLLNENPVFSGVNSPLSSFRLFLHLFANALCLSFGLLLMHHHRIVPSLYNILLLLSLSESCMAGTVDLLPNLAESLQTALLVDYSLRSKQSSLLMRPKFLPQLLAYLPPAPHCRPAL